MPVPWAVTLQGPLATLPSLVTASSLTQAGPLTLVQAARRKAHLHSLTSRRGTRTPEAHRAPHRGSFRNEQWALDASDPAQSPSCFLGRETR